MAPLTGMAEIAAYIRRSEAVVLSLIRNLDFPAGKIGGMWESDTALVDEWRIKQVLGGSGEKMKGAQGENIIRLDSLK